MKTTVDLEELQKILKLMHDFQEAEGSPYKYILFSDAKTLLEELIATGIKENKKADDAGQKYYVEKTSKPEKHDDSQIPVRSKEANIQAIKDAIKASSKSLSDIEIERLWKEGVNKSIDQCELNYKLLLDTLSNVVDILSAFWWNNHTKEAQHSARVLEPILEKLEDINK